MDGGATAVTWSNNANLVVPIGRSLAPGDFTSVALSFVATAKSTVGTSLEGRLSKANNVMQVSSWFPILSSGHALRYPGGLRHVDDRYLSV